MPQVGRLLAAGRDAEIFEYGPDAVLRRTRTGRSLAAEARVMAYVADQGYPVPWVDGERAEQGELVLEYIAGPTLVDAVARRPWRLGHYGRTLADLHRQLHEIAAPAFLPASPIGPGERVIHLDLHPLNVLVGPRGPVVIDWSNAARGRPDDDVALAWALMAAGEVPAGLWLSRVVGIGRAALIRAFLGAVDREGARRALPDVVAWKALDPHLSAGEVQNMRALAQTGPL